MNICKHCTHCVGSFRYDWRLWLCRHPDVAREEIINPVSGEPLYIVECERGWKIHVEQQHPLCKDINLAGDCGMYSPKERE